MVAKLLNILLRILFYSSPTIKFSREEEKSFHTLFEEACLNPDKMIEYNLTIPKYKFMSYIAQNKSVLLHGSNNPSIPLFEPRNQTLYNGEMAKAVFATKDPIWPIFFAVFNKDSLVGSIRNGAFTTNGMIRFHYYSLNKQTMEANPWTTGTVYILPIETFKHISKGLVQFDEWISEVPVAPIAKLQVKPEDFYFIDRVAYHKETESIIKSWLLYKIRTFKS